MKKNKLKFYSTRYILVSPLKVKRVLKQLSNFNYHEILLVLKFLPYPVSKIIFNSIKSLIFMLYNNKNLFFLYKILNLQKKFISGINRGPILKRLKPKARGKSTVIKKRMSHFFISLT